MSITSSTTFMALLIMSSAAVNPNSAMTVLILLRKRPLIVHGKFDKSTGLLLDYKSSYTWLYIRLMNIKLFEQYGGLFAQQI